ncbi:TrmO family methyltransferase [uncultured Psychrobacter sp.]|uniref:SAM-dependent methyltransferase n=1 Tax=uncultured Psychrobacter sp. TaxID=259303 RepID=UPI00345A2E8B
MSFHHAPVIGYHRAPLSQKFGAPRQPNLVDIISVIEMIAPYDTLAAFVGLEAFSHIWLSWQFHHNYVEKKGVDKKGLANKNSAMSDVKSSKDGEPEVQFRPQVRPPRLGGNQKIGVFASRSMYRPSGLGLSVVKLEKVTVIEGRVLLIISGADMIDGTPIIDIKPYVAYSDALVDASSGFAPTAPKRLMVTITDCAYEQFIKLSKKQKPDSLNNNSLINSGTKNAVKNTESLASPSIASTIHKVQKQLLASDMELIKALIAQDPRPAYRRHELDTVFTMRYKSVDISFWQVETGQLQITAVVEVL